MTTSDSDSQRSRAMSDWTAEPYYDKEGKPIKHEEWVKLFEELDTDRNIAWEPVSDDVSVSTVWIGIDHSGGDRPLIYETMVFGGEFDKHCIRSASETEAIWNHGIIVARLRKGLEL